MKTLLIITVFCIAGLMNVSGQEKSQEMLNKAIYEEEVNGNLEEAIEVYQTILDKFSDNRSIAAKAQFHIGLCNEKLGKAEASKAYQLVLDMYPDQGDVVAQARVKLIALNKDNSPGIPKAITTRQIWPTHEDTYHVSPDGRFISFINWKNISVNVYEIATGEKWRISDEGTWEGGYKYPDISMFSPDSKQLLYVWYDGGSVEFIIASIDGSSTRILVKDKWGKAPWPFSWSNDGNYILGIREEDNESEYDHEDHLISIDVNSGEIKNLFSFGNKHLSYAQYSPNGQYIIHELEQEAGSELMDVFIMNSDGSKSTPIVEHPANDYFPFWSQDGKFVMFLSDRTGSKGLWCQKVEDGMPSGEPVLLKANLEDPFHPLGITANGSLFYATGTGSRDVYTAGIDLDSGELTSRVSKISKRFEGKNSFPAFSPDGKYLSYLSFRENSFNEKMVFVIHELETGTEIDLETDLYPGTSPGWFVPRWTPDSKLLLVMAQKADKEAPGAYTIDILTGKTTLLGEPGAQGMRPLIGFAQFGSDEKKLYHLWKKKTLASYNTDNHQTTRIFDSDKQIYYTEVSPDGKYFAFRYWFDKPNELWILSTDGGEPTLIGSLPEDDKIDYPCWTPDNRNVVLVSRETGKIYKFPIDGTGPVILNLPIRVNSILRIHPDGKQIVFDQATTDKSHSGVWALDSFMPKK